MRPTSETLWAATPSRSAAQGITGNSLIACACNAVKSGTTLPAVGQYPTKSARPSARRRRGLIAAPLQCRRKGRCARTPSPCGHFTGPATGELREITSPHIAEQLRWAAITVVYRFLTFGGQRLAAEGRGRGRPEGRPYKQRSASVRCERGSAILRRAGP